MLRQRQSLQREPAVENSAMKMTVNAVVSLVIVCQAGKHLPAIFFFLPFIHFFVLLIFSVQSFVILSVIWLRLLSYIFFLSIFWFSFLCEYWMLIENWFFSSGKSHSGANQQDVSLLKAILTELQERQEDCAKLKEAVERLEVCCCYFLFVHSANWNNIFPNLLKNKWIKWFGFYFHFSECSKRIPRCVTWTGKWTISSWTARRTSKRFDGASSGNFLFDYRSFPISPYLHS